MLGSSIRARPGAPADAGKLPIRDPDAYTVDINSPTGPPMGAPLALTPDTARAIDRTCLCLNVQRAARAIGRQYDAALRPVGLSNWQFTLLMMLTRKEPPTISTLAHDLAMDRTTVTANLKPLERRGLLAIEVDARGRRVRRAVLTGTGRALLNDALPLWQAAQAACSERLGEDERTALLASMRAVSV